MTTPEGTKQARVSAEAHRRLMDLALELKGTADDALRHLLGMSAVRVPVTDIQRERWAEAARRSGVPLAEFVALRVEACLMFGTDGVAIRRMVDGVDALCRNAGLPSIRPPRPPANGSRP